MEIEHDVNQAVKCIKEEGLGKILIGPGLTLLVLMNIGGLHISKTSFINRSKIII